MRAQTILILSVILASLPVATFSLVCADAKAKPGEWQVLFEGKSVDKWRGYKLEFEFGSAALNQWIARSKFNDMPVSRSEGPNSLNCSITATKSGIGKSACADCDPFAIL